MNPLRPAMSIIATLMRQLCSFSLVRHGHFYAKCILMVFSGSDLFYSAPLWPIQIKLLITIAQYDTPDGDGEVDGVIEVRKVISLTDSTIANPGTALGNSTGNDDFTQPVGLLTGRHLPYGTWNVTVQVINDANLGILNAFGSFM